MAFRLSNNYEKTIQLTNEDIGNCIVIVYEAVKRLGWNIRTVTESSVVAFTNRSMNSWGEQVTIQLRENELIITSKCISNQLIDWGKNKGNIEDVISGIEKIKHSHSHEAIEQKAEELKTTILEHKLAEPEPGSFSTDDIQTGFLAAFIPTKEYFITPIIIYCNIIIFLCMLADGANIMLPDSEVLLKWGANYKPLTLSGEWWRLLSSCFVHIGILHIALNLYALVFIGRILERFIGLQRFLTAYLLTGLLASLASLWWHDNIISAGASGAIFGMYGVFLAFLSTDLIEKTTRKTFLTSIGVFVAYNLFNGLTTSGGVDNAAHIGGLLSGFLIGLAYVPSLKNPKHRRLANTTSGLLIVSVVTFSCWFCYTSPNDFPTYEKKMLQFAQLESEALEVLSMPETTPTNIALEKLRVDGIDKWKEANALVESCNRLKLPMEIQQRNWKLSDYCDLRITSYNYIYQTVNENTTIYQPKIDSCNALIEEIVFQLSH